MEFKAHIRRESLTIRRSTERAKIELNSEKIAKKLIETDIYNHAEEIYCYVDVQNEVITRTIINHAIDIGKSVAVPKVQGAEMEFYYIHSLQELKAGYMGIPEPAGCNVAKGENGLLIMPLVAYDKNRNRIGYGGGFYDRYIADHKNLYKIALGFEFQRYESIPYETHDIKPDMIISEKAKYE